VLIVLSRSFGERLVVFFFEAYVLHKAGEMRREFCFRDFLELEQAAFHRILRRLRRKGRLMANPQRN